MTFSNDNAKRKSIPIFDGVVMYFPDALAAVAEVSRIGNEQHNPGQPLHWAREKSTDQFNTALRHLIDHKKGSRYDTDGARHLGKAAWRILAALQLDIEAEGTVNIPKPIPGITDPSLQGQCAAQFECHLTPAGLPFEPSDNCDCDVCRNWQADWPIRALNEYLAIEFWLGV